MLKKEKINKRSRSGDIYSNNYGAHHAPDSAVKTTEQRGSPAQYPGQALATTTPTKPPIRGKMVPASGPTSNTRD